VGGDKPGTVGNLKRAAPLILACTVEGYSPVRKLARLGVQIGSDSVRA